MIIALVVLFLLVGGGGGYLLWRVNQKETVAPTDSDASGTGCLDRVITVTFSPLDSKEGYLVVNKGDSDTGKKDDSIKADIVGDANNDSKVDTGEIKIDNPDQGKVVIDKESGTITQTFRNSCDTIYPVTAVAKEGYKFSHWDDLGRKRKNTNQTIQLKFQDCSDSSTNNFRAVFVPEGDLPKYKLTYVASCPGYDGDLKTLLTCADPAGRAEVPADSGCLNQSVIKGENGKPVYVTLLRGAACTFKYWEVGGKNVGSDIPHIQKEVGGDMTITAVFEYIYNGSPFSFKYSSKGEGHLKVDGKDVRVYPVSVLFQPGQPYPKVPTVEAVPKEGWVFDKWESNIRSFSTVTDSTKNPRNDEGRKTNLDLIAVYKQEREPQPNTYTLKLLVDPKDGGKVFDSEGKDVTNTTLTIQVASPNVTVRAVANKGYKFVGWADGKTDNPRKETMTKDLVLTAKFVKDGGTLPPDNPDPDIPEPDTDTPTPDTGTPTPRTDGDTMPQTAAFSEKSIYIITVGTLVLCLGMVWQYIPKDIFKRLRIKK